MNFSEYNRISYQKHFQPEIYQKAFDGHLARIPWELTALPRPYSWIKGSLLLRGRGWEGNRGRGKGVKRKGREWRGRGERRKEGGGLPDTPLLLYTVTVTRLKTVTGIMKLALIKLKTRPIYVLLSALLQIKNVIVNANAKASNF